MSKKQNKTWNKILHSYKEPILAEMWEAKIRQLSKQNGVSEQRELTPFCER